MANGATCVASAVNVLSGGEQMENVYLSMVQRMHEGMPDQEQETRTAEEIKTGMMMRINALSGG